jgi:hypothetical protein
VSNSKPTEISAPQYYAASLKIQFATYKVLALSRSPSSPLYQTVRDLDARLRGELEQMGVGSCMGLNSPSSPPEPGKDKGDK